MDMEPLMSKILRKLEVEYKDEFETFWYLMEEEELVTILQLCWAERACVKLGLDIDTNVEEKALDFEAYSLCRTLIEFEEIIKREKDPAKKLWLPRVTKDVEDLMNKWDRFVRKWEPAVLSRKRSTEESAEDIYMLEEARQMLVSCLQDVEDTNGMHSAPLFAVAHHLGTLVTELMLTIHENFKQNLVVTPNLIAEVASPLTGIPASWLLHFSEPPLQGVEPRLAEALIGQDHVPFVISNALSRRRVVSQSHPRPIGSFLFLNSFVPGWTETAKALAEQLLDDKERMIRLDLSEYSDSESVSRLTGFPSSILYEGLIVLLTVGFFSSCHCEGCCTEGLLTEAVKRRPFTVVVFDNVDRAHPSVTDVLIEIISHGRISIGQGSTTDFTKTLIIMTSNITDGKGRLWSCKCVQMGQEIALKDLFLDLLQQRHKCLYLDLLREFYEEFANNPIYKEM
ncbi:chaperone protein ClpB1-like [Cornus florida]|uniref:chaperone protein ClpB1-like n=1 Tax=Cornus florida TaxID=4283 RepID=UPI0028A056EF|nr:chaperone protein ClpB1-like [Cornus florida]